MILIKDIFFTVLTKLFLKGTTAQSINKLWIPKIKNKIPPQILTFLSEIFFAKNLPPNTARVVQQA